MSAQPADAVPDPLDPELIAAELPEDKRGFFLAQYRIEAEAAREPGGWKQLHRFLRLWRFHAEARKQPGYAEARDAALAGTGGGMSLEDVVRLRSEGRLDEYIARRSGG